MKSELPTTDLGPRATSPTDVTQSNTLKTLKDIMPALKRIVAPADRGI